jgi:hypothetical protein
MESPQHGNTELRFNLYNDAIQKIGNIGIIRD